MEPGEKRILVLSSLSAEVRRVTRFCRRAAEELFPAATCQLLELAVSEAFTNIIKHGYRFAEDRQVWLTLAHEGDHLSMTFEDEAEKPLDLESIPQPPLDVESVADLPESGRGLFLIRQAMDEISYGQVGGRNCLRLVKRLSTDGSLPVAEMAGEPEPGENPPELEALQQRLTENEETIQDMAGELSTAYESLNCFYSFTREVSALTDEERLVAKILEAATTSVNAAWAVLRFRHGNSLQLKAVRGLQDPVPETVQIEDCSLEARVAIDGREEVAAGPAGTPQMCLPLLGLDLFLGTLLLGRLPQANAFSTGEMKLARALTDQAAVCLENQRMVGEIIKSNLARRELDIAQELQQRLYPREVPRIPGLTLFAEGIAARQVGGDYLALLSPSDGTLDFIIADALGKGMSAAFFSILTHIALRSILDLSPRRPPAEIMTAFNRIMAYDLDRFGMFMTALFGRIDLRRNTLTYASAGHCRPLLILADGQTEFLETPDYMLGIDSKLKYQERRVPFLPGMKLLVYTDGFTDVPGPDGRIGGEEMLLKTWTGVMALPFPAACRSLIDQALAQMPASGLQDDLALIGIERAAEPVKDPSSTRSALKHTPGPPIKK